MVGQKLILLEAPYVEQQIGIYDLYNWTVHAVTTKWYGMFNNLFL